MELQPTGSVQTLHKRNAVFFFPPTLPTLLALALSSATSTLPSPVGSCQQHTRVNRARAWLHLSLTAEIVLRSVPSRTFFVFLIFPQCSSITRGLKHPGRLLSHRPYLLFTYVQRNLVIVFWFLNYSPSFDKDRMIFIVLK